MRRPAEVHILDEHVVREQQRRIGVQDGRIVADAHLDAGTRAQHREDVLQ